MNSLQRALHRARSSRARLRRAHQQLDPAVEDLEDVPADRDDGGRTDLAPADIHRVAVNNDLLASIRAEGLAGTAVDHAGTTEAIDGLLRKLRRLGLGEPLRIV